MIKFFKKILSPDNYFMWHEFACGWKVHVFKQLQEKTQFSFKNKNKMTVLDE